MPDIFISHSYHNQDWVESLATALQAVGYTVWWQAYSETTNSARQRKASLQALQNARCVITVWSKQSVDSTWVLQETTLASRRHILLSVLMATVNPPLPFNEWQSYDLQHWQADTQDYRFRNLLQQIEHLVGRPDTTNTNAPTPNDQAQNTHHGLQQWLAATNNTKVATLVVLLCLLVGSFSMLLQLW